MKPLKRGKFKVSGLRDVLLQCADMLYKAISKQNPEVDQDDVEDALRALVRQLGASAPAEDTEATASVHDDRPDYNLAADILAIAHEHHQNKDFRTAFKMFSTAMDAEGMEELIAGIKEMNANTTLADTADAMSDDDVEEEESDEEDAFADEDEAMEETLSEFDDEDDGEDDIEDDGEDAFESDPIMDDVDSEVDASLEEDDEEEIDDEEDDPALPMQSTAALRALANKASLDGSNEARLRATRILNKR
jgi:hypothetical protein